MQSGRISAGTVRQAIRSVVSTLDIDPELDAKTSAAWIVSHVMGFELGQEALHDEDPITSAQAASIDALAFRRLDGEPLQYICGHAPFRRLDLVAERGVFVPRPETEVLVGEALALADGEGAVGSVGEGAVSAAGAGDGEGAAAGHGEGVAGVSGGGAPSMPLSVLDLCCGSGAVAVSMAFESRCARCLGVDVSEKAVALSRKNAALAGVADRCEFALGSLFEPVPGRVFDMVLANPPYVPSGKLASMPTEVVGWEPALALDGGPDGLDCFRSILEGLAGHLAPGGWFLCELDEDTLGDAVALCGQAGLESVSAVDDLAGRPRIVRARMPL